MYICIGILFEFPKYLKFDQTLGQSSVRYILIFRRGEFTVFGSDSDIAESP